MARSTPNLGWLVLLGLFLLAKGDGKVRPSAARGRWSDDDMRAFLAAVVPTGVPVDAVLHVYASESGLDPQASSGIAWGIAQFTEQTLRGLGWKGSGPSFGSLSVAEQAPYVGRLLKSQANYLGFVPRDAVDLYAVNFWPESARRRDDVILMRDSQVAKERNAYAKNRDLDRDKKGWISRGDLAVSLARTEKSPVLLAAQQQARRLAA